MSKYRAVVSFITDDFEAGDDVEANAVVMRLIDQLGAVVTDLSWDDVDWDLMPVKEEVQ